MEYTANSGGPRVTCILASRNYRHTFGARVVTVALEAVQDRAPTVEVALRAQGLSGAPHSTDVPYLFDTLDARYKAPLVISEQDRAMSLAFGSYFAAFAKHGDPNATEGPIGHPGQRFTASGCACHDCRAPGSRTGAGSRMHGLIFVELKKYCDARLGPQGWDQLLERSGMGGQIFVPLESYPDRDALTLEFLCNVEDTIHATVRRRNMGAEPPQIKCAPSGQDEVTIVYTSQRKLCALARGLIRGVANSYRDQVSITESSCMLTGASQCKLIVRVAQS